MSESVPTPSNQNFVAPPSGPEQDTTARGRLVFNQFDHISGTVASPPMPCVSARLLTCRLCACRLHASPGRPNYLISPGHSPGARQQPPCRSALGTRTERNTALHAVTAPPPARMINSKPPSRHPSLVAAPPVGPHQVSLSTPSPLLPSPQTPLSAQCGGPELTSNSTN